MKEDFAEPLERVDRLYVRAYRRKLLYFAGCDYYRLSSHPEIIEALHQGLDRYGLNTAASRKTTGNHPLYEQVESATAKYFGAERAVLVSSGYLSNIAVAQALREKYDHFFVDERCHGSLQDAVALAGGKVTKFRHRDACDLKRKSVRLNRPARVAVVTDGIFAFDGSVGPITEYRSIVGPNALLWVDDAHAAGVIGGGGQGSIAHFGLSRRRVIQTITFSKAFGVYGGAVLCDEAVRQDLIARSSAIAGNTPLPLPLAFGCLAALRLLDTQRQKALRTNIEIFWREFAGKQPKWATPIIGPTVKNPTTLKKRLLEAGIYPSFIRYPGGPAQGYFRFALSSEHTPEQIRLLAEVLRESSAA